MFSQPTPGIVSRETISSCDTSRLGVSVPGLVMQTLISGLAEPAGSLPWLTSSTWVTPRLPETLNQARPAL